MATMELEEKLMEMENRYAHALSDHKDIHSLSAIWQKIKEIKFELHQRNEK